MTAAIDARKSARPHGVAEAARTGLFLLMLVLAGCVSLTPYQHDKVAEIERFADRTTALYGLQSVRISIQSRGSPRARPSGLSRTGYAGLRTRTRAGRPSRRGTSRRLRSSADLLSRFPEARQ